MILTDYQIKEALEKKEIIIEPLDLNNLGANSYDVHLSPHLAVYHHKILDAKIHNTIEHFSIGTEGFVLEPGILYLGATEEYTETHHYVPFLEGKSSTGRLGIHIHATAGKGDIGFCNTWTLELSVVQPVRIYAGMPIAQLIYFKTDGRLQVPYHQKISAKYTEKTNKPVESMMWKNFK